MLLDVSGFLRKCAEDLVELTKTAQTPMEDPLGVFWPGINKDDEGRYLSIEEEEEGSSYSLLDSSESPSTILPGVYEYNIPQKYLNFDVEFLVHDDTNLYPQDAGNPDTPLDDFDGNVPKDQISDQDWRQETKRVEFRKDFDYPEFYDQLIYAKHARVKTAAFKLGDYVHVVRPWRYGLSGNPRRSVGRILGTMDNGWLMIVNMQGEQVAVYSGLSHEDSDVAKIDLKKLLIQEEAEKRKYRDIMFAKFAARFKPEFMDRLIEVLRKSWGNNLPRPDLAIDEDKGSYLIETYHDEGYDA